MKKFFFIMLYIGLSLITGSILAGSTISAPQLPHYLFVNGFAGLSIAEKQNGFWLDGNGDRDNLNDFTLGETAPLVGAGIGYYLYYFAVSVNWSERINETGSATFTDNTDVIINSVADVESDRLIFSLLLFPTAIFHIYNRLHLHPYFHIGIGFAWNRLGTTILTNATGTGPGSVTLPFIIAINGSHHKQTAYQIGGGISGLIMHHLLGFVQYNYTDSGDIKSSTTPNFGGQFQQAASFKLRTHEIVGGLALLFY